MNTPLNASSDDDRRMPTRPSAPGSALENDVPLTVGPLTPGQPFLLASLLTAYPGEDFTHVLLALFQDDVLEGAGKTLTSAQWGPLLDMLQEALHSPVALDDLRSEYIDRFDRGASAAPLYQTEYGRDRAMRKTAELVDLAGFYRAFGFQAAPERPEMLDHLAVELEFYGLLLLKEAALRAADQTEGVQVVMKARRKFLHDHLGSFPTAVLARPSVQESAAYRPVLSWVQSLVEGECRRECVAPLPLEWVPGQQPSESLDCAELGPPTTAPIPPMPV